MTKALEALREEGKIGSSLQAEVRISAEGDKYAALASLGDDLRFVLICSKVSVAQGADASAAEASTQKKCERCWHYREDVGSNPEHPELCGRCDSNLHGEGEVRERA